METGKTTRYLQYAIGEIILVIIGILIALQINNWNQERLNKKKEYYLVNQLLQDAKADSIFFKDRLNRLNAQLIFYEDILNLCNVIELKNDYSAIKDRSKQPFIRLGNQSNLLKNNPDAYSRITNLELKRSLQKHTAQYEFAQKSLAFFNAQIEDYITPLRIKYYPIMPKEFEVSSVTQFGFLCDSMEDQGIIDLLIGNTKNSIRNVERYLSSNHDLSQQFQAFIKKQP
jgi:hypothetical protein